MSALHLTGAPPSAGRFVAPPLNPPHGTATHAAACLRPPSTVNPVHVAEMAIGFALTVST